MVVVIEFSVMRCQPLRRALGFSRYWGKFGETGGNLHFHVSPRLNAMTAQYLKCYPTQKELIHGPMLFDWAREPYKVEGGELSIEELAESRKILDRFLHEIERH